MRRASLAVVLTAILLAFSIVPLVRAGVYTDSASESYVGYKWTVSVKVDTDKDTIAVQWSGPAITWFGYGTAIEGRAWDDKGWSTGFPTWGASGSHTIKGYTNTNTDLHVRVTWLYKSWFPGFWVYIDVKATVAVGP